jgi:glucose-1-phosphate thymidylyltransferase
MKGVILTRGKGTRLSPLTEITNKHLLPIGKEPMIWHSVKQLVSAGIGQIMVITSTEYMGHIVNSLGSGKRFDCEFTYRIQEEARGIAYALTLAEHFTNSRQIIVLLADNMFQYSITPYAMEFKDQNIGARVLIKEVG